MKTNLVVSCCTELWLEDADQYQFLTEYGRDRAIANGISPEKCLYVQTHPTNTQDSIDRIENYLKKLLPVIADSLVQQHGHDEPFWRRTLFFYLRDIIDSAYTVFEQLERVFDPVKHELLLAKLPERVPLYGVGPTLEDALYWGITDEGREYYSAEYFRLFYPGKYPELPLLRKKFSTTSSARASSSIGGLLRRAVKVVLKGASRRVGVLVTNAQYEQVFAKRMLLRSRGKVSFHYSVPSLANLFVDTYAVDQGQRKCIAKPFADSSDRFEQYLGRCLETSLPWSLVEGFESALSLYRKFWADFPQLKYVISENLYQQDSLPRAVCAELGVELITLPHFFPLEIFAGSRLTGLQVQDRFIARGSRQLSKSTIGSGTVFPYRLAGNAEQKEIDTLYVATDFYAYFRSLQQSADGCGYDVYKQFKQFVGDFLEAMPRCAIEKIALKNRPSHSLNPLQLDYPSEMKLLDSSRSAKAYMSRAKLIVVEGMSTTMFEALASNIPTIAFWPADLYQLRPEFVSYFSVLEKAGIVVHDPIELAQQTQIAQQDAKTWWMSGEKQAARAQFLEENLHGQDHFEKLLLSLIRGQSALPEDGRSGRQYPPN